MRCRNLVRPQRLPHAHLRVRTSKGPLLPHLSPSFTYSHSLASRMPYALPPLCSSRTLQRAGVTHLSHIIPHSKMCYALVGCGFMSMVGHRTHEPTYLRGTGYDGARCHLSHQPLGLSQTLSIHRIISYRRISFYFLHLSLFIHFISISIISHRTLSLSLLASRSNKLPPTFAIFTVERMPLLLPS